MINRILVPLDGSKFSERALLPALALARQAGAELILLSVPVLKRMFVADRGGVAFLFPEDSLYDSEDELAAYLDDLRTHHAHPKFTLRTELIAGDEAGVIVDTAVAQKVDLIIMSTHGRSGFQRWLLGSVTERVLQSAPCPVLVIRSNEPINKVLIPLDGSRLAECALEPGLEIAHNLGCAITLLTVVEHFDMSRSDIAQLEMAGIEPGRQLEENLVSKYEAYLLNIEQQYRQNNEYDIHVALAEGPVAQSILVYAGAKEIDLIAMTTHGRTGLRRWLYGSVTEKVLRGAPCHVLVVRPPDLKQD